MALEIRGNQGDKGSLRFGNYSRHRQNLDDNSSIYKETEDIMSDQEILLFSEEQMDLAYEGDDDSQCYRESRKITSYVILTATPLKIAVAILARTLMPAVLKIYYIYLRNQQIVVKNLRTRFLPSVLAFVANSLSASLATVQRKINYNNLQDDIMSNSKDTEDEMKPTSESYEKSVDCRVLHSPPSRVADVIFIHGLHGGMTKTWKQGQWRHDGHKLKSQSSIVRRNSTTDTNLLVVPSPDLKADEQRSLRRAVSEIIYTKMPLVNRFFSNGENIEQGDEYNWDFVDKGEDMEGPSSDDGFSDCWPRDWIPKDCPGARVIALNYSTDILWCPVWKKKRKRTDIVERSDEMIEELLQLGVGKNPIIWVGHSKGGLFIKQILLNAWEIHRSRPDIYNIFHNSKGIMFYSVPHKGSVLADVTLPLLRRSVELIEIQRNCDFVLDMHRRFLDICQGGHCSAEIFSFIETSFTLMSFIYLKIVAYDSADPNIGIKCDVPLDHREICKPAGRDCFLYIELVKLINKYSRKYRP